MKDGEPNTSVPDGKEVDKPVENSDEPVSLYDKTEAMVTRQEAANKKAEEILDRQEKLHANQRLAGTAGGNVEAPVVSPEDAKKKGASEFFKGTALGEAIEKS